MGIVSASVMRKTMFKGDAVPFVMELPNYRMPGAKMLLNYFGKRLRTFYKEHLQ